MKMLDMATRRLSERFLDMDEREVFSMSKSCACTLSSSARSFCEYEKVVDGEDTGGEGLGKAGKPPAQDGHPGVLLTNPAGASKLRS